MRSVGDAASERPVGRSEWWWLPVDGALSGFAAAKSNPLGIGAELAQLADGIST